MLLKGILKLNLACIQVLKKNKIRNTMNVFALVNKFFTDRKLNENEFKTLDYQANVLEELQESDAIQPVLSPETGWQSIYMNPKFV